MKYFLDTEYTERPGLIQLISIGIVDENGRTFYAENTSFDERMANGWVKKNVLDKLKWWGNRESIFVQDTVIGDLTNTEVFGTISTIKKALLQFFKDDKKCEFWAYFANYDWVIFCWIFGQMADLPKNFPFYCRDLKQSLDEAGKKKIPDPIGEHNALIDALWNKELYGHIYNEGSDKDPEGQG